jgi:predicted Zn-dependent protease
VPDALATLARLETLHPQFSRLHQERGHCHILLATVPAAIEALRGGAPELDAAGQLGHAGAAPPDAGDAAQAAVAAQHLAVLKQLPVTVVVANSLFADGDLSPAEEVLRVYLRQDGGNVGALRLLARIRQERGALDEAEALLASVLEHAPDFHAARLDYAMVLLQGQKPCWRGNEAELLLAHDPDNRDYLKHYGAACVGLGDHEPVIDLYARLLDQELVRT